MKGNYQAVITISDVEDALEAAELLLPLKGVAKVKIATISPRPVPVERPLAAQQAVPQLATPPKKPTQPSG